MNFRSSDGTTKYVALADDGVKKRTGIHTDPEKAKEKAILSLNQS